MTDYPIKRSSRPGRSQGTQHVAIRPCFFFLQLFRDYWLKAWDQAVMESHSGSLTEGIQSRKPLKSVYMDFSDLGTCNLIQFVLQAVLLGNRYYKHKCLKSKRFQLPFLKTNSFVFQPLDKVRFRMLVWRERGRTNLLRIVKEGREMKHFLKRYKICIYIYIFFQFFLNQFLQCGFVF